MKFPWQEERASAWEDGQTDRRTDGRPQTSNLKHKPSVLQVGYFSAALLAPRSVSQAAISSRCGDPGCAQGTVFLFVLAVQGTFSPLVPEQYT